MTQVPLPPPPPTGGPIDGWLYLLWRRLTQAGQILWESILPGTSADVAAVVTDETGSPGSLVFSGNPTLDGVIVDGLVYVGDTTAPSGATLLGGMFSTNTAAGAGLIVRKSVSAVGNTASINLLRSRGTNALPEALVNGDALSNSVNLGFDGTNYSVSSFWIARVDGAVSTGVVPGSQFIYTTNSSGTTIEAFGVSSSQVITLGGTTTAPALKVTPVASQARWIEVTGATSSGNPKLNASAGSLELGSTATVTLTLDSSQNADLEGVLIGGQSSVAVSTALTNLTRSVVATATGTTQTLPAASAAILGGTWTVSLGATGYVDITVTGADTFNLPTADTTIRLTSKGDSVSIRCTSATQWSIV